MNFITYYSPAKYTSPSYHPQPDGIAEWFKETLKAVLWRQWQMRARTMINFSSKCTHWLSTFELLYGRVIRLPPDILKDSWLANARTSKSNGSYNLMQEGLQRWLSWHKPIFTMNKCNRHNGTPVRSIEAWPRAATLVGSRATMQYAHDCGKVKSPGNSVVVATITDPGVPR